MSMNNDDLLKFIIENGMIDIDDVQQQMNQKKKEEFVSQSHTYRIWQGSNGRWYTYLPDETRPKGRRQIAKANRELIVDTICNFYHQQETKVTMTLEKLYPEWLEQKALHLPSTNSVRRIDDDWHKYYLNDPIIKRPLSELTYLMLDEWAHKYVRDEHMTKTCYFNMSIIIRQSLLYAVEKGYIPVSPFSKVKIDKRLFTKPDEKDDQTQVFLIDEIDLIIEEAMSDYNEKSSLAALAIPFAFQTGLRLGELVALRFSDIIGSDILIQRMEAKYQQQASNGAWYPAKKILVDHVKSDAGKRKVYLTGDALKIISLAKETIKEKGYSDEDFIFQDQNGRITSRAVDSRIRKYCRHIEINEKSTHKIRKTYISTLIDSGININKIRNLVGHEDERTTYHNYTFNRLSQEQTNTKLENALCRFTPSIIK